MNITACIRADGEFLPPFIIGKGKESTESKMRYPAWWPRLSGVLADTTWVNARCVQSENAYMTDNLFSMYINNVFLPYTEPQRRDGQPIVLVYDNCKSHVSSGLLDTLAAANVVVVGLPPHSSHATQPLDVSIMQPLKAAYRTAEQLWRTKGSNMWKVATAEVRMSHDALLNACMCACLDVLPCYH